MNDFLYQPNPFLSPLILTHNISCNFKKISVEWEKKTFVLYLFLYEFVLSKKRLDVLMLKYILAAKIYKTAKATMAEQWVW